MDLPWLAGGAGVFACLDPGPDLHTTHVLLTYTGVLADGVPLEHELLLANDMVPDSLSPPFADASPGVAQFVPEKLSSIVGMPWGRVLATTVSMLLYLCSEGPDVRRGALPPGPGARPAAANSTRALQVGWRLGAALRAAQRYHSATRAEETDLHVLPHLRRSHWHHYWTGPLNDPEQRQLVLRYLAPISVGSELPVTTVVRPAS